MRNYCFLIPAYLIIYFTPLVSIADWHNQARIGQALVYICFLLWMMSLQAQLYRISGLFLFAAFIFFAIGLLSSVFSLHEFSAITEVALIGGSILFSIAIFSLCKNHQKYLNFNFGILLRFVCASLVFGFYIGYIAALLNPNIQFEPRYLIDGFSNIRFQGQFFTLAVPLLLFPLFIKEKYEQPLFWLDRFLAVSCITMVVMAGTRGSLAGWFFACVLGVWLGGLSRILAWRFLTLCILGFGLAWMMQSAIYWLHSFSDQIPFRMASENVFSLSLREIIWSLAWQQFLSNPWLGIGPMNFAALGSNVAAHPHQLVLQFLCEWGLPATLLVLGVVFHWFVQAGKKLKHNTVQPLSAVGVYLYFALAASMMQAMVDGVLVMPYTQLWLFLMAGWAVAVFSDSSSASAGSFAAPQQKVIKAIFLTLYAAAMGVLLVAIYVSWPYLVNTENTANLCNFPRFWVNGCLSMFP